MNLNRKQPAQETRHKKRPQECKKSSHKSFPATETVPQVVRPRSDQGEGWKEGVGGNRCGACSAVGVGQRFQDAAHELRVEPHSERRASANETIGKWRRRMRSRIRLQRCEDLSHSASSSPTQTSTSTPCSSTISTTVFRLVIFATLLVVTSEHRAACTGDGQVVTCHRWSAEGLRHAFERQPDATVLDLRNVHIHLLQPSHFRFLPTITHLYLDRSSIDFVANRTFEHMTSLQLLSLRSLRSDPRLFLPSVAQSNILAVDIAGVYSHCSCGYWQLYNSILDVGCHVVESKALPFCNADQINMCTRTGTNPPADAQPKNTYQQQQQQQLQPIQDEPQQPQQRQQKQGHVAIEGGLENFKDKLVEEEIRLTDIKNIIQKLDEKKKEKEKRKERERERQKEAEAKKEEERNFVPGFLDEDYEYDTYDVMNRASPNQPPPSTNLHTKQQQLSTTLPTNHSILSHVRLPKIKGNEYVRLALILGFSVIASSLLCACCVNICVFSHRNPDRFWRRTRTCCKIWSDCMCCCCRSCRDDDPPSSDLEKPLLDTHAVQTSKPHVTMVHTASVGMQYPPDEVDIDIGDPRDSKPGRLYSRKEEVRTFYTALTQYEMNAYEDLVVGYFHLLRSLRLKHKS